MAPRAGETATASSGDCTPLAAPLGALLSSTCETIRKAGNDARCSSRSVAQSVARYQLDAGVERMADDALLARLFERLGDDRARVEQAVPLLCQRVVDQPCIDLG